MKTSDIIILAAGGTGGHIFPALAVAQELGRQGHAAVLIKDQRLEIPDSFATGVMIQTWDVPRPYGLIGKLRFGIAALSQLIQLLGQFLQHRPRAVVGFGGYPAFVTMLAAWLLRIPLYIHEPNAILGRTNSLFARQAKVLFAALPIQNLPAGVTVKIVGNPVRQAFYPAITPYVSATTVFNLVVLGGSQGAQVFGQVVPQALALLPLSLRTRLRLWLQVPTAQVDQVLVDLEALEVQAHVAPFFEDVPELLSYAHLVMGRSGAGTVAEVALMGRPCLFVPLPSAKDDHQAINAAVLARDGAAWMMRQHELTPQALASFLEDKMLNPKALAHTAALARTYAQPDAAVQVVKALFPEG